jgi:hypothetical protein
VEDGMIEVIIAALAGTLLLIAAGSKPRVPAPVRVDHRKR